MPRLRLKLLGVQWNFGQPMHKIKNGVCSSCPIGCNECDGTSCIECQEGYSNISQLDTTTATKQLIFSNICLLKNTTECPKGSYYNSEFKQCLVCSKGCAQCSSQDNCTLACNQTLCTDCLGDSNSCLECKSGAFQFYNDMKCLEKCENQPGYYFNQTTEHCQKCSKGCTSCQNDTSCDSCDAGMLKLQSLLTQQEYCVSDCFATGLLEKQSLFNNITSKKCDSCGKGCLKCQDKRNCTVCPPQSSLINGTCRCEFTYQVTPSVQLKKLHVVTNDISWGSLFLNKTVPCDILFQEYEISNSLCSGSLPYILNLNNEFANQFNYYFYPITRFGLLSTSKCMTLNTKKIVYQPQIQDFIEMDQTHIHVMDVDDSQMLRLLDGRNVLKLNTDSFIRKSCIDQNEDYFIQIVKPKIDNQTQSKSSIILDSPLSNYSNSTNSSYNQQDFYQQTKDINSSDQMAFYLDKYSLVVNKCSPVEENKISILYSQGYENGYSSFMLNMTPMEDSNLIKNGKNISDYPQLQNSAQNVIQKFYSNSINFMVSKVIDFNGLLDLVDDSIPQLNLMLNLTLFDNQMTGSSRVIIISLQNFNQIAVAFDKKTQMVVPNYKYQLQPILNRYSCQGISQVKLQTKSLARKYGFQMNCSILGDNYDMSQTISNCLIPANTLIENQRYDLRLQLTNELLNITLAETVALTTETVVPFCKFKQGSQTLMNPLNQNKLSAFMQSSISSINYQYKWSCMKKDQATGEYFSCLNFNATASQTTDYLIAENIFEYSSSYIVMLHIHQTGSLNKLSDCSIQIDTVNDQSQLIIPISINSEVDTIGKLPINKQQFKFVCEAEKHMFSDKQLAYRWILIAIKNINEIIDLSNKTNVMIQGKYIRIQKDTLIENTNYMIQCQVMTNKTYPLSGAVGLSSLLFNTQSQREDDNDKITLTVDKTKGDSYVSVFNATLTTTQEMNLYCLIGYNGQSNKERVIIYESQNYESNISLSVQFTIGEGVYSLFATCTDSSDINYNQQIQLNSTLQTTMTTELLNLMNQKLMIEINSINKEELMQALQISNQFRDKLNSTFRKQIIASSINMMMDQLDSDITDQDTSNLSTDDMLNIVATVLDQVINDTNILNDPILMYKTANIVKMIAMSSTNTTTASIERNNNETIMVNLLDDGQFNSIQKTIGALLDLSSENSSFNINSKELLTSFAVAIDSYVGNLMPNEMINASIGQIAYSVIKMNQGELASNDMTNLSINSEKSSKQVTVMINVSDPIFAQYENLILKSIVYDNQLETSNTIQNQSISIGNASFTSISRLASDILVLNVDTSSQAVSLEGTYDLENVNVQNLTTPIEFKINVTQSLNSFENITERYYQCVYFDDSSNEWKKSECGDKQNATDQNYITCCSTHMTKFTVLETVVQKVDKRDENVDKLLFYENEDMFIGGVVIAFNSFLIVFGVIGCTLDCYKSLLLYAPIESTDKETQQTQKRQAQKTKYGSIHKEYLGPIAINQDDSYIQNEMGEQTMQQIPMNVKAMDPTVRPPFNGHMVSEQEEQPQRKQKNKDNDFDNISPKAISQQIKNQNKKYNKYSEMQLEGGSSEEDDQAQELQNRRRARKKLSQKKQSEKKKELQQLPAEPSQDQHNKLFNDYEVTAQYSVKKKSNMDLQSSASDGDYKKNKSKIDDGDQSSSVGNDHVQTKGGELDETKARIMEGGQLILPSHGVLQNEDDDDSQITSKQNDDEEDIQNGSATRALRDKKSSNNDIKDQSRNEKECNLEQQFGSQNIEISFKSQYLIALQCYNRLIGILFRETPFYPRFMKVLNSTSQFSLILMLTGLMSVVNETERGAAILISIAIMRIAQILLNIMISKSYILGKAKLRNILVCIFFFIVHVVSQIVSMRIFRDRFVYEIDEWKGSFIATIIIELILIDFVINPLVLCSMIQCCCQRACKKFLSPSMSKKEYIAPN
ncbi:egf-like domain containing protein [Stylonychia lemnae]|uniref:Egf-like domain containing protein n=1 Tax=Stylonychia lemnae TaxID=5949 RepID=A0A077ZZR2_STYLE|nr:egf-like domain containing protein [Stylonychia lemnae]|eukprot:CDW74013.1 egf-like domain containing protein [Stylonychia lemnae]